MKTLAYYLSLLLMFTSSWENIVVLDGIGRISRLLGLVLAAVWFLAGHLDPRGETSYVPINELHGKTPRRELEKYFDHDRSFQNTADCDARAH